MVPYKRKILNKKKHFSYANVVAGFFRPRDRNFRRSECVQAMPQRRHVSVTGKGAMEFGKAQGAQRSPPKPRRKGKSAPGGTGPGGQTRRDKNGREARESERDVEGSTVLFLLLFFSRIDGQRITTCFERAQPNTPPCQPRSMLLICFATPIGL